MTKWFDAAARGNLAELQRHIDRGQKINAKDKQGWTALVLAIDNGHAKAAGLLLENKADPKLGGPAFFAIDAKRPDLLEQLLEHGLDANGGERGVGLYIEKAILEALLENGGRGKGKTDVAARPGGKCLRMLIGVGAKLRQPRWTDGESPLRYPVAARDLALLRYLIEHGADVNAVIEKRDDFTPLMWCARYSAPDEMIRLLVKSGAKLEHKNRKGLTALDLATVGIAPKGAAPLGVERKSAKVLQELGAKETPLAKAAKAKRAKAAAKAKKAELAGDAIEAADVAQRRGTLEVWSYDTWTAMAVRADDLDALADALEKSKNVREVRRDVTKAALAGTLTLPKSRYAVILKLKGHAWASVDEPGADVWYEKFQKEFSRHARQPVISCGHQDTAGASFFWLHEKGKLRIDFQSTGAYEDDPAGTRLKSDAHQKHWWQQQADENETIQALLREQDAYVPMFNAYEDKGKLLLQADPEDTLKPANVERIMLVVYDR